MSEPSIPNVQAKESTDAPIVDDTLGKEGESDDLDEWEDEEGVEAEEQGEPSETSDASGVAAVPVRRKRRRKKLPKADAEELRLLGRRALCKKIADIASFMQRIVKNRILKDNPYAKKMEDDELTSLLKKEAEGFAKRERVLSTLNTPDEDFARPG